MNASEIAKSMEDPVLQEGGIQENLLIKNCPKAISDEIQDIIRTRAPMAK